MLRRFLTERQWYQELGVASGPPPDERDWQDADDYDLILKLIDRYRAEQTRKAQTNAGRR